MTTGTPDNVCVVDVTACESDEKAREVMVLQLLAAKRILRGILELIPSVFMNEVQSQDVFDLLK